MTTRKYSSRSQQTTLAANLTDSATSCTVVSGSALLGGATVPAGTTFTVVIDPDTALEEIVDVTVVSTNVLTITRGVENSGTGQAHSAGAAVRHMAIGRDFREANLHIEATGGYNDGTGAHTMHGIAAGEGDVVGTAKTQTLTNKTLTAPTITNPSISGAGVDASIVFEGATPDAFETTLTVVDPTQDNTITMPNTTGTVVLANAAQTLTNKTIDMTGVTLTGLSSAGMSVSSATPKNYVDSILGSATSAATSAASAATSATSAATSAGSAETSAIASAASASTSATSAASATTSASSAATSAASALTSANSASASATTAANSVATIAGYATTAANSASAAATSATSASASATAAATSATSAAASATAAATSATSAAASAASIVGDAAAAATSAASASTSAASAATSASSALTSANSASASATTAANSVATIAGYATSSANSATAAATSATSASNSATAAATSASSASTSASSALTSATSAATSYDEFDDRYLGAKASPPSVDNDGNALLTGALYWNTVSNKMFVWSGSAWTEISSSADIISYKYTVAGGATSVSGADDNGLTLSYTVGKEQVYINGVLQVRGSDYTASTGTSITGMAALTASDIVTILAFTAFVVANTYTIAQADATFIPDAIVDAKGDLIVATAADTVARLAAGSNGDTIVADSSTATGLRYQGSIAGGKNFVINGGFDIWQRGTSFSNLTGAYAADRFAATWSGGSNYTISRQTSFLTSSRYALRVQRNSGETSTATLFLGVGFETVDVIRLQGKTVTWSFYVKAGSNYSPAGGGLGVSFYTGTGTDQGPFVGHTGEVVQVNVGQAITTTGTRYSYTFTVPTNATSARFNFAMVPSGTAGANDFYEIANMQLEIGSVATEFSRSGGTIQGELAACQRYYWRQNTKSSNYSIVGNGFASSTSAVKFQLKNPVTMRVEPTSIDSSGLYANDGASLIGGLNSVTLENANETYLNFTAGTGAGSFTANRPYNLLLTYPTAYIGCSAEL